MRRLAIAILTVAAVLGLSSPSLAAENGDKAPAFTLPDLAGGTTSYTGKGEIVFVNFWATWCAPCVVEFPKLNELAAAYKGKVRVIAISVDEDAPKAKIEAFVKKRAGGPLNLTVALDGDMAVAERYGIEAMPTSFIVDKVGNIRFTHVGFDVKDPEIWKTELDSLLK